MKQRILNFSVGTRIAPMLDWAMLGLGAASLVFAIAASAVFGL